MYRLREQLRQPLKGVEPCPPKFVFSSAKRQEPAEPLRNHDRDGIRAEERIGPGFLVTPCVPLAKQEEQIAVEGIVGQDAVALHDVQNAL